MSKKANRNEQLRDDRDGKNLEFSREFCNIKQERMEKNCDNCKR